MSYKNPKRKPGGWRKVKYNGTPFNSKKRIRTPTRDVEVRTKELHDKTDRYLCGVALWYCSKLKEIIILRRFMKVFSLECRCSFGDGKFNWKYDLKTLPYNTSAIVPYNLIISMSMDSVNSFAVRHLHDNYRLL